jgi:hypothetical protein
VLRTYPNLKLLGKNPKMICGFEGRETGEQAAAGVGGGTRSYRGLSAQRRAARGDGCPMQRPSGSAAAAAAPLGLRAGPEPQRSGGSGGLTILPRGLVPSNLHRPRGGSACGSSLTLPAGGASACCPDLAAAEATWGGWERREEDWICSGREQRSLEEEKEPLELEPPLPEPPFATRVGPRQCSFLSPIVNITSRLSPLHTRNQTSCPVAPLDLNFLLTTFCSFIKYKLCTYLLNIFLTILSFSFFVGTGV